MSEPTQPNLGNPPPAAAGRDAVHVAIIPVTAGEDLLPGDPVMALDDGRYYQGDGLPPADFRPVGVVDPFLTGSVPKGTRFWLCLRPGTVTSIRHVWQSPDFPAKVPGT